MRTLALAAAWTAVVALLAAGPATAPAQEGGDEPSIFFSPSPDLGSDAKPARPNAQLNLRPNREQAYFVYVYNPGKKAELTVELVSERKEKDADGREVTSPRTAATAKVVVEGGKSARVSFPGGAAAPPPAADKGAAAPPPAVTPLYDRAQFRIAGAKKGAAADVGQVDVSNYTAVKKADEGLRLTVGRKGRLDYPLVGGPIPVRLEVRKADGSAAGEKELAVAGNALKGELALDEEAAKTPPVVLALANPKAFDGGAAEVYVDGVRAVERYPLGDASPAAPAGLARPPAAVRTGTPLAVRLLSNPGDAAGGAVEVVVADRRPSDDADPTEPGADVLVRRLPTQRDKGIDFRAGPAGEAVFVTRSRDWELTLPTDGLYGPRKVYARRAADGSRVGPVHDVVFDGTAPTAPLTVDPAPTAADPAPPASKVPAQAGRWYRPGQRVLPATAATADSGIQEVLFYLGAAPGADGKDAPGGASRKGVARANRWEAESPLVLPAAPAESAVVGVVVTSNAGLKTTTEVRVNIDPTPPEVSVVAVTEYGYAPLPPSPAPTLDPPAPYDPYAPRVLPAAPAGPPAVVVKPARGAGVAYRPGETVRFSATAADPQSGLDDAKKVLFFVGDPPGPDGQPVQGTVLVQEAGLTKADGKPTYAFDYTIPKEVTKDFELKAGFWFVNRVGLAGTRAATLKVEIDTTVGTIVAKVSAGSRLKPGVPVRLIDQANSVAAEAKTDVCGVARFEKLLPGRYAVQAFDPADGNAQNTVITAVRGGETKEVALSLKRSP